MKRTTSYKLSDMTLRQIKELQDALRMSQTELLAIAIDRMYQREIGDDMRIVDMRICSVCGHEYNAGYGPCDRCDEETADEALLRKAAEAAGLTEDELMRRELGIDEAERQEANEQ